MKTTPELRGWKTSLWRKLWRKPIARRLFYEFLGLIFLRRRGMQMLNCGYQEPGYPRFALPSDCEAERLGFQLYHRLVRSASLGASDVLEVGCGRGGGARFLAEHFHPRSYVATDSSRLFILGSRLSRNPGGLRFRHSRANRLPFGDATFDLGIAVEALHLLGDKTPFLGEMGRVLRAGGRLFIVDFFYARENSANSLASVRAAIGNSAFEIDVEEDWTENAIAALETDSPRRLAEIGRLPRFFREPALSFACTAMSPLYQQFRDRRSSYVHFQLSKR